MYSMHDAGWAPRVSAAVAVCNFPPRVTWPPTSLHRLLQRSHCGRQSGEGTRRTRNASSGHLLCWLTGCDGWLLTADWPRAHPAAALGHGPPWPAWPMVIIMAPARCHVTHACLPACGVGGSGRSCEGGASSVLPVSPPLIYPLRSPRAPLLRGGSGRILEYIVCGQPRS
jgi:hypothetical protein